MSDPKGERRAETATRIKSIARARMAEHGAASLSLGSIAREMGISTPALYRYFANRDALVNELVLESYVALGDETERAVDGIDAADLLGRFRAMAHAYRAWALDHPQDYVLLHGAVLPGYQAPLAQIATSAVKLLRLFVQLLADGEDAGRLRLPTAFRGAPTDVGLALQPLTGAEVPPRLATYSYLVWSQLHALVWQEIHGHLPRALLADGELYGRLVEALAEQIGFM